MQDEGEYGDVASVVPPTTKNEATGKLNPKFIVIITY